MIIKHTDTLVRETLTSFVEDVFDCQWRGREHEAISRYVIGYLVSRVRHSPILKEATQICINGAVPGVPKRNRKDRVNKDLQIWPLETQTTWNLAWMPDYVPICIQEWKVSTPRKRCRPKEIQYDVDWLCEFTAIHNTCIGYAVVLDLTGKGSRLSVTRILSGKAQCEWLKL